VTTAAAPGRRAIRAPSGPATHARWRYRKRVRRTRTRSQLVRQEPSCVPSG
jgi:hypothetical protein